MVKKTNGKKRKQRTSTKMPKEKTTPKDNKKILNRIDSMRIDPTIIVHNAGYLSVRPTEKLSNIHKLFLVNSIGPISITEHFLPKMKQNNNGHLIFNSPPIHFDRKMKYYHVIMSLVEVP